MLAKLGGLSSMAAAAALNAGNPAVEALELLESGRAIIASLVLDMRTDLSELAAMHPDLADQFVSLRNALDTPEGSPSDPLAPSESSSWELRSKERQEKQQKFHDVCHLIRSQPGFENFLRPPTANQMLAAARPGSIIVVNACLWRCDAFIITPEEVIVIPLPKLDFEQAEDISQKLQSPHSHGNHVMTWILEWAWDVVARPCLEAIGLNRPPLDMDGDTMPRIWWILAGPLSHLPIHAAGRHAIGSNNTVMDRAMSSYSLSIKTLLHGRRSTQVHGRGPSSTALLIDMGITNNQRALPFARDEIAMLEKLCSQIQLQPIHPAHKRKEDVLSILKTCTVFHFAGHGKSHGSDPSHSCLLLDDWQTTPLSVADLRDNWVEGHTAFLAYLSACSTGSNKDGSFADEAIHLVSGCQLAGFRHVVGTLWAVSDHHCVDVARTFYRTLQKEGLTDRAVCKGLHQAAYQLRNMDIEDQQIRAERNTRRGREPPNPFLEDGNNHWAKSNDDEPVRGPVGGEAKPSTYRYLGLSRLEDDWWYTREFEDLSPVLEAEQPSLTDASDSALGVYSHERDATLCDSDEEDMPALSPLLWAPYFHTGV